MIADGVVHADANSHPKTDDGGEGVVGVVGAGVPIPADQAGGISFFVKGGEYGGHLFFAIGLGGAHVEVHASGA